MNGADTIFKLKRDHHAFRDGLAKRSLLRLGLPMARIACHVLTTIRWRPHQRGAMATPQSGSV